MTTDHIDAIRYALEAIPRPKVISVEAVEEIVNRWELEPRDRIMLLRDLLHRHRLRLPAPAESASDAKP